MVWYLACPARMFRLPSPACTFGSARIRTRIRIRVPGLAGVGAVRALRLQRVDFARRPKTCLLFSSSSSSSPSSEFLVNATEETLDWNDRIGLQQRWDNNQKGWQVAVEWRPTPYGAGLFALQDIAAKTVLRRGVLGKNLLQFKSIEEIQDFCQNAKVNTDTETDTDTDERSARLHYVKDYLWGFYRQADERGYPSKCSNSNDNDNRFFGMWIPGNGLNHNMQPNTVYRETTHGIDLVALVNVQAGQELYDDYRRHGTAPPWLQAFAKQYAVTLNFADCNDFVDKDDTSSSPSTSSC